MTVVLVRSYSRMIGRTSCDSDTDTCGQRRRNMSPIACSWAGLTYACSNETAIAWTPRATRYSAAASACSRSSGTSTWPVLSKRSSTSRRSARSTSGRGLSQNRSYSLGTRRRRSSSTSRKPRVVSSPVSAPLNSRIVLVATVVPWTTSPTASGATPWAGSKSLTAWTTARPKSSGVDSSLRRVTLRWLSTSTISVNVPPTSAPTRAVVCLMLWTPLLTMWRAKVLRLAALLSRLPLLGRCVGEPAREMSGEGGAHQDLEGGCVVGLPQDHGRFGQECLRAAAGPEAPRMQIEGAASGEHGAGVRPRELDDCAVCRNVDRRAPVRREGRAHMRFDL